MNQLKQLLQERKTHKLIRLLDSDGSVPPPVELLVYAIHAILAPAPEYTQLPDLIRLLTMVEFWRIRAMSVVSAALVWQAYHQQVVSQTTILLDEQEESLFRDHENNDTTWRNIFIKLIATCISTHLLRLWLDLDGNSSHTLFWVYWNEYFKPLENPSQVLAQPDIVQPFHHRLSISDIDQLLASLNHFANFIRPSIEPEDPAE
jgi:hypothetical protein